MIIHKFSIKTRLSGFSTIELSVVLIIVGVLLSGVMYKAQELLESSKLSALATQIHHLQTAITAYRETQSTFPGFSQNGNIENSRYAEQSARQAWTDLHQLHLVPDASPPTTKLGGRFSFITRGNRHYMMLCINNGEGLLTPHQANQLCKKLGQSHPNTGSYLFEDPAHTSGERCLANGNFNLKNNKPACVVYVELS